MNHHLLKCRAEYFKVSWAGYKPFEIRLNDRNFQLHDEIILQEITGPCTGYDYTGREIIGFITYLTDYEQKPGYIVFAYREAGRRDA